jgi:hypothetical protein
MPKYLHLYKTIESFESDYNGLNYLEPWASATHCQITGVTTSFTVTDDDIYGEPQSRRYTLKEFFMEPRESMDNNVNRQILYAKYVPEFDDVDPGFLTISPTGTPCSEEDAFYLYGNRSHGWGYPAPILYNPSYGITNCSAGTITENYVNYNRKESKIVATFTGQATDYFQPGEGKWGSNMNIVENHMPKWPFLPGMLDEVEGIYDVKYSLTYNGVTYTEENPNMTPVYFASSPSEAPYLAWRYQNEDEGFTLVFYYRPYERKLTMCDWEGE